MKVTFKFEKDLVGVRMKNYCINFRKKNMVCITMIASYFTTLFFGFHGYSPHYVWTT